MSSTSPIHSACDRWSARSLRVFACTSTVSPWRLSMAVAASDAIVIASPEYAHGVSGTIKNTLDWLVSFPPFIHKPVAVINVSPRAHHADDALRETLRTMSAGLVGERSFPVALLGAHMDEAAMAASPGVAAVVAEALAALRAEIERQRAGDVPVFPLD